MTPPLRSALVYKGEHPAARIDKYSDRTEFRYLAPYLASDLPAVATTLPKRDQIVTTYAGAIPPFFAGLLPEGHRLSVLQRSLTAPCSSPQGNGSGAQRRTLARLALRAKYAAGVAATAQLSPAPALLS